ncbi:MAG: hypothetical protein ACK4YV_12570 [Emticicia sp.]
MKYLMTILCLLFVSSLFGQNIEKIALNKEYPNNKLDASENLKYAFRLEKEKSYKISVMQEGIDVAIVLFDKENKQLIEKDTPNGQNGLETFNFSPTETADFYLMIKRLDEVGNPKEGTISVIVKEQKVNNVIKLEEDTVSVQFELVNEWIFINGEVNGVKGRFMFDTGSKNAVTLNSIKIKNIEPQVIGEGFVGSGQSFKTLQYPKIDNIKIDELEYIWVENVNANNMDYLNNIATDVIGMVGFNFFKGYNIKIDYLRRMLTFYKHKANDKGESIKKEENYITTLPYFTRKLDNHPMIMVSQMGVDYLAAFDTGGGRGSVSIEQPAFTQLKSSGEITNFLAQPSQLFNLHDVKIDKNLTTNLFGLAQDGMKSAFVPLGITEKNVICLAYSFLSNYTTVWDTQNKMIHIFEKK